MSSNDTAQPRFYKEAVENKAKSAEEGRPIFDEREMVEIVIPGDRLAKYVGYVTDVERERFPAQYAAFKRGEARAASGTPLEVWPVITASRVAELKALNILSVEELANVSDANMLRLGMGGRELREQARAYLDTAKAGASNAAMAAEIARLKEMVEALTSRPQVAPVPTPEPPAEKPIEDCTDAELKAFIKKVTGEGVKGNPSRETLIARATELAQADAA